MPATLAHWCSWHISAGQMSLCVSTSICSSVCVYPESLRSVTVYVCHLRVPVLLGICGLQGHGASFCLWCLYVCLGLCASVHPHTQRCLCVIADVMCPCLCFSMSMCLFTKNYCVCVCVCSLYLSILHVNVCDREDMSVSLCVTVSVCHCGGGWDTGRRQINIGA